METLQNKYDENAGEVVLIRMAHEMLADIGLFVAEDRTVRLGGTREQQRMTERTIMIAPESPADVHEADGIRALRKILANMLLSDLPVRQMDVATFDSGAGQFHAASVQIGPDTPGVSSGIEAILWPDRATAQYFCDRYCLAAVREETATGPVVPERSTSGDFIEYMQSQL